MATVNIHEAKTTFSHLADRAHRDPFNRLLAAQSILEQIPVVSIDEALSALGASRIWE